MKIQADWLEILVRCKENVKTHIRPLLKTLNEPQPDLGRGAGGDPMKLVDLAAEKAIVEVLQQCGVSFTLISEESGVKEFGEAPRQCYVTVDPIDGTVNLVRGLPFYASSIAVSAEPVLSSVYAALVTDLFRDITYTAQEGKGAYRDGEKIKPSALESLEEAVIGLDLNTYKVGEIAPQLTSLIQKTRHIRHFGANALELCYVADGTTDAFVDIRGKLRTTDMAAGFLILREAGGTITTPAGHALDVKLDPKQKIKFIASGNMQIHKIILSLIKPKKETKC
ncbi:MAG TPA: inositol monophosphatase family protein [Candidatus Bathyarchaeia archaeon]|nr:inositol monophosphatase family protein [Candidatus Bathyarchaeia archaeon]